MNKVTMFQTHDGALHKTAQGATRYLDKMYGDKLSALCHAMLSHADWKYGRLVEFIDGNLSAFVELQRIAEDNAVSNDTEE